MQTFEELGFSLFGAIFLCIVFIPLICFLEVVPFMIFLPDILDNFNNIAAITIPLHALIGLYLVVKMAKAKVVIKTETPSVCQEDQLSAYSYFPEQELIVCRCLWGTSGITHRFAFDNPITVNIERFN